MVGGMVAGGLLVSLLLSPTPSPAATAARAPVPTFTPTPALIYAQAARLHQVALAEAMTAIGQLLAAPRLADADWVAQVETAMTAVETAYAALVQLVPEAELAAFHGEMSAGAADCTAAMRVLDLVLDEYDRAAVPVVGALLRRCQTHLDAAQPFVDDGVVP